MNSWRRKRRKKMDEDKEEEIWSEYFRIKNELHDEYKTLLKAMSAAYLHLSEKKGTGHHRVMEHLRTAQRQIYTIITDGIDCKAFKSVSKEDEEKITRIGMGFWKRIEELEWCKNQFSKWFRESNFFDVNIKRDRMKAPHEL
jgi:hypothetical protein